MVEKIYRLKLDACTGQLQGMLRELELHKEEFISSPRSTDIEREWIGRYVHP